MILLALDFLWGNAWAAIAKKLFQKLAEVMLVGAVIELYHQRIGNILEFLGKKVGYFIPNLRISISMFSILALLFLFGVVVQSIEEGKPLAPFFFRELLVFCLASTISVSLSYTVTYLVLHLVVNRLDVFLPKYLYLVTLELLISYFMAPLGYAALFLFNECPSSICGEMQYSSWIETKIRMFGMVISTWPYSTTIVSYRYIYNFQSLVNFLLLHVSMLLCILPTILHIVILVSDILRYTIKNICEHLMEVFDRLATGPAPVRRFLLGVISILSVIGWLLE